MSAGPTSFRINRKSCTFAQFTPEEVAGITGLSTAMQKVWLSRRFLSPYCREGRSFTAPAVGEIFLRYQLSRIGVGLDDTEVVAAECAALIFWYALINGKGAIEAIGTPDDVGRLMDQHKGGAKLADELTGSPFRSRYLCRVGGSAELKLATSIDETAIPDASGLMCQVDLEAIGTALATRAGRPLIHVELLSAAPNDHRIRQILCG